MIVQVHQVRCVQDEGPVGLCQDRTGAVDATADGTAQTRI